MRKGSVNQFITELEDKILDLKTVESSGVIDDGEDTIFASPMTTIDSADDIELDDEVTEIDDNAEYLTDLYAGVEDSLNDLAEGCAWSSDDDNIYLDVNFINGHVFTFTIPKADLSYDIAQMDKDVEYVCVAVRDTQDSDEDSDTFDDSLYNSDKYEPFSVGDIQDILD